VLSQGLLIEVVVGFLGLLLNIKGKEKYEARGSTLE
jgi:hypothetical protein